MGMLNILIFNWRDPKHPQAGGAEKVTYELAKRFTEWGCHVQLLCGNYPNGQKHDNIDGIKITRLGGKYSLYSLAAVYYQRKLRGKYDVIIDEINTVPFFTPLYVKEPKLAFIHQLAAEILFEELPLVQAKFWAFMEPWVLRLYKDTSIITVSESTKEDLIRIGIPPSNIYKITEGLDHGVYVPCGEKSSYPHVLFVGRIKRFKGIHHLIKAMKLIVEKLPNARLSIVGRGDLEYWVELKWLTKALKLENNVVFHGYVSEEEKIKLMQHAHALVLPSQREGFGLVVIEANACGTAAIATDVPGLRDAVAKDETGIFVPYGNIRALTAAVERMLTDEELRERLSRNAVKWAKRFSWDRTATEALSVIRKVVGGVQ